jgi:hypothetical protein
MLVRIGVRTSLVAVLFTSALMAQTVVVGTHRVTQRTALLGGSPTNTFVDLSNPATADGNVTVASVGWLGANGCTGAMKVKFLRPAATPSLTTFTSVGDRGPFAAQPGMNVIPINPPIAVKKGDLIAVTTFQPFLDCGSVAAASEPLGIAMELAGDVANGSFNGRLVRGYLLAVRATDTQEVLEGVITAAGSLQGNFGSFFRTSLQIGGQPYSTQTMTGKLIFHPAGAPASPTDQAVPYTVTGGNVLSFDDIVQHMGKSGLGTIDVVSTSGGPPLVTARVYNDTGATGTSGFTEDLIRPDDGLRTGEVATLVTPSDLTNYRVNVGIRTFGKALKVNVQFGFRKQGNVTVPANTFQQLPLASLLTDVTPVANERIFFFVTEGAAIIYASTTDNRTNDSSVRFLQRE